MAIFNSSTYSAVVEQDESMIADMYPNMMPTAEAAYEIACEGYGDIYKILGGLYIADVMVENAVMTEGADGEALIEGVMGDFFSKAKKKFIEIKNKIIAWFKKVIDNLKVRFTSSKKFVAKYKDQFEKKVKLVGTNYKPSHHSFDENLVGVIGGGIKKIAAIVKNDDKKGKDFTTKMVKAVDSKAVDVADLKEILDKKIVGGEPKETSITSADVSKMVKFCDNMSVVIGQMEDIKKESLKVCDDIIDKLEKAETKNDKEAEKVRDQISNYNTAISAINQLNGLFVKLINQINTEYVGILRGLMLAKVKESFGEDFGEESSIFESALNMI